MNEERLIKTVKDLISQGYVDEEDDTIGIFIKLLNLLETQSKQIDLMAKEMFYEDNRNIELQNFNSYEQIIEYFKEKVDEENE